MINLKITIKSHMLQTRCNNISIIQDKSYKNKYNIFNKYNGRYLRRSGVRVVMPTWPCSHVRQTPQPAEESVDQQRRSRFTVTGFSTHDDSRKKISRTTVSYGSNSRHTHEVVPGDGDCTVLCRNHKNTRPAAREKQRVGRLQIVSAEKSPGSNGVHGPVIFAITHRSKILEHHTPTPLSGAPVNTKWGNLNDNVTLARMISFSNSNYYLNHAKQIYPTHLCGNSENEIYFNVYASCKDVVICMYVYHTDVYKI
jgi:hypothetical protein